MSSAVFLAGGGAWSLDERFVASTRLARSHPWTNWLCSGPLPVDTLRKAALAVAIACAAFTVVTYQILFGAVVSPLHSRVNFHRHHVGLGHATATAGGLVFEAYVDAGPDTGAAYIIAARLADTSGALAAEWDGAALAALPAGAIANAYPYAWASRFKTERIGFSGQTGARATITLPAPANAQLKPGSAYQLELEAIDGTTWTSPLRSP
jgi:thiosulfate dehydrogenase [quinone] large subunit